jgi:hypothetical protein
MAERCGLGDNLPLATKQIVANESKQSGSATKSNRQTDSIMPAADSATRPFNSEDSILEALMQPENTNEYLPYELRKTRKKRKKRTNRL